MIRLSSERKVIVDTNIPCDILRQIPDYDHVAIMLSPQAMWVDQFFDWEDPEKQFTGQLCDIWRTYECRRKQKESIVSRDNIDLLDGTNISEYKE